ncbi:hypothetical protein [Paludisphaera soli]|uniref:hypothetical protein n=1 Tax=Paludisphaera soli TaxID=2712865 RepID=UPI0013EA0A7A|nr:hypothetical protein [Paludisphaera soli]
MADSTDPAARIIDRVHPEWAEHQVEWRWLYDSWEGGERYRNATYGSIGGFPLYNLIRHKRELPDPSPIVQPGGARYPGQLDYWSDDFEMRRARTPVPDWVESAVDTHLSKIYAREVRREAPEDVQAWFDDVDGMGTSIDEWMRDVIAPLVTVLGCLDVLFDHPKDPDGEPIASNADEKAAGTRGVVATYILPTNLRWWRLDARGRYAEAVVREYEDGAARFRHWTAEDWTLYDARGELIQGPETHDFGRVPIVRLMMGRKPRCRNVGTSVYKTAASLMREFYNRDSELILSDTTQAHPLLQCPEDYIKADGTLPVGPNWLLPKKKNAQGGTATYEGFDVVEFPKEGADSLRINKADLRDAADRSAYLQKPAGAAGSNGTTVAQTGISKRLDQTTANDFLAKVSGRLQSCEYEMVGMARLVLSDGADDSYDDVKIAYPTSFDLFTAEELAKSIVNLQDILEKVGAAPKTEVALISTLIRAAIPGREDEEYAAFDAEIKRLVGDRENEMEQRSEAGLDAPPGRAQDPVPVRVTHG